ncbi:alpha/beta hydrolase family protein [Ideonella dechloratans]|uniref:alpha/beta hydrolase family protein n=1 Tax=Ideonella dechloratans TaxID=36863 RepID=UPI0035B45039
MRFLRPLSLLPLTAALVLAGCGGGSEDAPPARGTIMSALADAQLNPDQSWPIPAAQIDAGTSASGVQALTGAATCDVHIAYVLYMTRDPKGEAATASTAVFVPSGTNAACTGSRPVVLYAHGTTTEKAFNMADIANNQEGSLTAAMFAAQGYIVVAPNYLGYDLSSLSYHPYLNAEAQAVDMVDGLRAAKSYLTASGLGTPSAQLFVTGYSEGGHVAMATQKVLERDYASEFTVTAAAPMSGPYNLTKFVGQIMASPDYCASVGSTDPNCAVNVGATLFTPLLLTSWQKAYGIYGSASDVYQAAYAGFMETLLPSNSSVDDLVAAGKLPADPTARLLFGTGGMINESFRTAALANASSGLMGAAATNTLLGWKPQNHMAMCYSSADPTVYGYNTTDAQADFYSRGVTVPALNLRGDLATIQTQFGAATAQLAGAFQQTYSLSVPQNQGKEHSNAAPFCAAFVRGYFANFAQ